MADHRYVVLGLARPRAPWFAATARWLTDGGLPVEFVKCLSATEVATRLASARPFSALLVDEAAAGLDRDMVDVARRHGCAVITVGGNPHRWSDLGAAAGLPSSFDRALLLDVLATHAAILEAAEAPATASPLVPPETPWRGALISVVGSGGVGASTVAMAIAQALADDVRHADLVVLADFARRADLAVLHDVGDVVPGVQDLVDADRVHRPGPGEVAAFTFDIAVRRYRLLLGLRRPRDWTAIRPRSFEAALDNLRGAFHFVVADLDADFEGDLETGSADIEDRNAMARVTARQSDVLVVVGEPGVKGTRAWLRVLREVHELDVPDARVLPVLNRAPRPARVRAEHVRAFGLLTRDLQVATPLPIPDRRGLDHVHRTATRLPAALTTPLGCAVRTMLARPAPSETSSPVPVPIAPGSLGAWSEYGAQQ